MTDANSDQTGPDIPQPAQPAQPSPPPAYEAPRVPPYAPDAPQPTGYAPQTPPAYAPGGYPAPPAYGGYPAPAKTNALAIVSLVSAIVGVVLIPLIGSIVAVITGHISLRQLRTSGEQGKGLATAGLIVGYIGIALSILGVVLLVVFLSLVTMPSGGY